MAVINKEIAYMALPLSIRRGNPFPLDEYSVWYDKTQLESYAQTSPVAYVGQIVVLVNEEQNSVEAYLIQNTAGALVKLAATTTSGDLTEDVLKLQGQVSALEKSVGTKGEESEIVATNLWNALEEIKAAYESSDAQLNEKIATAISTTYKPAGTIDFASLPELNAGNEGKVYNISDTFVTNSNFVEGEGQTYPAGTNIVCIEIEEGTFKWDVLAGFIDLSGKVDKVPGSSLVEDTDIAKLKGLANIKGVSAELQIGAEDGILTIVSVDKSKITGLDEALNEKVDVEDGKTLIEQTLIDKLKAIEDNAQVNKIEVIKINGTILEVLEDKSVDIPIATSEKLGVVKSAQIENSIQVQADGSMTVNSLNINKLVQTPGEELILNGGTAAIE